MGSRSFNSPGEIYDYLLGFVNVEKGQKTEFKLDRMRALAEELGDPHRKYRTVHVAGSKGKGSVSVMAARILESAGLRTGLYTSPHLVDWQERISLAGSPMPEEILLEAAGAVASLVDGRKASDFEGGEFPTYFELTTLIGFLAFSLAGCEAAVIETGLGGRLDSTNIVEPEVSVITPIELEHTEFLGNTLGLIAGEKAGIIKPGVPVCISGQKEEALGVFRRVAKEKGSPLIETHAVFPRITSSLDRSGTRARLEYAAEAELPPGLPRLPGQEEGWLDLVCPLVGSVQAENMGLALIASSIVCPGIGKSAVLEGLSTARLPARFELTGHQPEIILDGAHTPASVSIALASLKQLFGERAILLFACAHDKKHEDMAAILAPHFESIVVTRPGSFKQSEPEAVWKSFQGLNRETVLVQDTAEAMRLAMAKSAARKIPLLVTGSFYLCAEARAVIDRARR